MARYSTPETRTISWGHNGITFLDWKEVIAVVDFPCGPQGPIDGTLGSPERKNWEGVREAWIEHAMLPEGAYFPQGLERGELSKRFILPVPKRHSESHYPGNPCSARCSGYVYEQQPYLGHGPRYNVRQEVPNEPDPNAQSKTMCRFTKEN